MAIANRYLIDGQFCLTSDQVTITKSRNPSSDIMFGLDVKIKTRRFEVYDYLRFRLARNLPVKIVCDEYAFEAKPISVDIGIGDYLTVCLTSVGEVEVKKQKPVFYVNDIESFKDDELTIDKVTRNRSATGRITTFNREIFKAFGIYGPGNALTIRVEYPDGSEMLYDIMPESASRYADYYEIEFVVCGPVAFTPKDPPVYTAGQTVEQRLRKLAMNYFIECKRSGGKPESSYRSCLYELGREVFDDE